MCELDVMVALARLHEEVERVRRHLNPMPDLITFASNDAADRLKRYIHTKRSDEDDETVYVNMKVNSEEDLPPKYINLYIDTKRDMNARYVEWDDSSDYIDTKVVHLNINAPTNNNQPFSSYPRYRRHRKNN